MNITKTKNGFIVETLNFRIEGNLEEGYLNFIKKANDKKILSGIFSSVIWKDENGFTHTAQSCSGYDRTYTIVKNQERARITIKCSNGCRQPDLLLNLEVLDKTPYVIMWLEVKNVLQKEISIERLDILSILAEYGGNIDIESSIPKWAFFGQNLLHSNLKPFFLANELYQRRVFIASGMASLYSLASNQAITTGFVTTKSQIGRIELQFEEGVHRFQNFLASCDAEGFVLGHSKSLCSEKLFLDCCSEAKSAILSFITVVGKEMNAVCWNHAPTGWSHWDYYQRQIDEKEFLRNVDFFARHRDELPVEYMQLDAGFEDFEGDWLAWNKRKFPHGPKWLADEIKKRGFKPGLWMVPLMVSPKSKLYQEHPAWIIKDKDGIPFSGRGYASDKVYYLDGTNPEVQEWLRNLCRKIVHEYGYEYIKIDGAIVSSLCRGGKYFDRNATMIQAYRRGIEAVREGMGDKLLMGGVFGPSIGLVNSMRIGNDVGARWDWSKVDVHSGERDRYIGSGNVMRCITSILNSFYMHGNLWVNDADYLLVRSDNSELTLDEAKAWASVVGLTGGTIILGDSMPTLSDERRKIISKVLPVYRKAAKPIDFLEKEIPQILNLAVEREFESWYVTGIFNYKDNPEDIEISFKKLGLDIDKTYHIYEFWEQKYYGKYKGEVTLNNIRPHSARLLSIRIDKGIPQLISTDFHITQGGVEIKDCSFDKIQNRFKIRVQSSGRKSGKLILYIPEDYNLKNIQAECLKHSVTKLSDELLEIHLDFKKNGAVNLSFLSKR